MSVDAVRAAAPTSEQELLARTYAVGGMTLAELARACRLALPVDLRRTKGWVGQLLEAVLGATAGSRAEPDFQALGIELKTVPIDGLGRPLESTYVCTVPLQQVTLAWPSSPVWRKLRRVLWVPVEGSEDIPLGQRRVGTCLLWSPGTRQEAVLRGDWEDIMEAICRGRIESITAHQGNALQVRPKAADSRQTCWAVNESGARVRTVPRGFYLRSRFTANILARHFIVAQ